jgi:hypothetical protein
MKILDDVDRAFPLEENNGNITQYGMSLRDYFAAKALVGLMGRDWSGTDPDKVANVWVSSAFQIADLMLAERTK